MGNENRKRIVRLKDVAEHLGVSPATVSLVLNRSPVADAIPQRTHERVFAAAEKLGYRPNQLARSLRSQRSLSVGVLVPEVSEGYAAGVMQGLEEYLSEQGYLYFLASHLSSPNLLDEYVSVLKDRSVEGLILLAAKLEASPGLPTIVVSNHEQVPGVTNVVVDQGRAAVLALSHLKRLGHEKIALFRGAPDNADAEERWRAVEDTAAALDLEVTPELTIEIAGPDYGGGFYKEGFAAGNRLISSGRNFTALFAFNDISAIGAMRAFLEAGRRVPEDISVVGFDDIQSAAFHNPGLTTVRQPLRELGAIASRALLDAIAAGSSESRFITVDPELIVRKSTAPVASS